MGEVLHDDVRKWLHFLRAGGSFGGRSTGGQTVASAGGGRGGSVARAGLSSGCGSEAQTVAGAGGSSLVVGGVGAGLFFLATRASAHLTVSFFTNLLTAKYMHGAITDVTPMSVTANFTTSTTLVAVLVAVHVAN